MDVISILLGIIFWPTALVVWLIAGRRLSRRVRIVGAAILVALPLLGAASVGYWALVQEPLFQAAGDGDVRKVESLLAAGANVNASSEGGCSALDYAVEGGQAGMVRLLLARGADVRSVCGPENRTPLAAATQEGRPDIAALLRTAGARE